MKKRAATAVLWFFATWYAWNFVAAALGVTTLVGPILGLLVAYLLAGDPFHRIYPVTAPPAERTRPASTPELA